MLDHTLFALQQDCRLNFKNLCRGLQDEFREERAWNQFEKWHSWLDRYQFEKAANSS